MALTKYLISAAAGASLVLAQSSQDSCSTSGTFTISSAGDASALASCTTYSGSIAIPSGATFPNDNNNHQSLSLNISEVTGDLAISGLDMVDSISMPSLQAVGGTFSLGGLTVLSTLSAPQLSQVKALNFTALPALQSLSFGQTGITKADTILVSNTGLSSLMGLNNLETVKQFNVNNNQALQNISLQVTDIQGALDIEANAFNGLAVSFPMLETAMNLTFRNCSSVSLPSLANTSQYLGFYGNTMQTLNAPNLTTTGGLVFVDNPSLTNVTCPQLSSINGSYQIANNTMYKQINGFPKVATIKGALDFNGNFTDVELPALSLISGAFNLQTSAMFDCSGFKADKSTKNIIKGDYTCSGAVAKPGGAGTKPSSTSGSSPTKSSSAEAVIIPPFPALMGLTSLFAGILQLVL